MIVLGNDDFAIGMRFAGLKESHIVSTREECLEIIKNIRKDEFIIANVSIINMVPELSEFKNIISIPDDPSEFKSTEDLNHIIKTAIGFEMGN